MNSKLISYHKIQFVVFRQVTKVDLISVSLFFLKHNFNRCMIKNNTYSRDKTIWVTTCTPQQEWCCNLNLATYIR